jgi:hypothetical protein
MVSNLWMGAQGETTAILFSLLPYRQSGTGLRRKQQKRPPQQTLLYYYDFDTGR